MQRQTPQSSLLPSLGLPPPPTLSPQNGSSGGYGMGGAGSGGNNVPRQNSSIVSADDGTMTAMPPFLNHSGATLPPMMASRTQPLMMRSGGGDNSLQSPSVAHNVTMVPPAGGSGGHGAVSHRRISPTPLTFHQQSDNTTTIVIGGGSHNNINNTNNNSDFASPLYSSTLTGGYAGGGGGNNGNFGGSSTTTGGGGTVYSPMSTLSSNGLAAYAAASTNNINGGGGGNGIISSAASGAAIGDGFINPNVGFPQSITSPVPRNIPHHNNTRGGGGGGFTSPLSTTFTSTHSIHNGHSHPTINNTTIAASATVSGYGGNSAVLPPSYQQQHSSSHHHPHHAGRKGGVSGGGTMRAKNSISAIISSLGNVKVGMLLLGAMFVIFNVFIISRYVHQSGGVGGSPPAAAASAADGSVDGSDNLVVENVDSNPNGAPTVVIDAKTPQKNLEQGENVVGKKDDDAPPPPAANNHNHHKKKKSNNGGPPPPATLGDGKQFKDVNIKIKKIELVSHDLRAWHGYTSMDDIVRKKVSKRHWGPSEEIVESSAVYQDHEVFVKATGCDLLTVPFNPLSDEKCVKYMLNRDHWKELRPLPMEFDQRTVKFEIEFKAIEGTSTRLSTIIKVPQRMFPYEAFSEVAAFHADRIMKINRVPPTTILWLPLKEIRASLDKHGSKMSAVEEFLKESKADSFVDWVEKDFLNYTQKMKWQQVDTETNELSVPISMQLRVADVGHLLDTALSIPYRTHNTSWHRYFDLIKQRDPAPKSDDGENENEAGKEKKEAEDNNENDDSSSSVIVRSGPAYENYLKRPPIFMKEKFVPSIVHISEIAVFDMVIGNDDRSPNKNNFVVGACKEHGGCADVPVLNSLKHPGPPTYIHLDQGMAFYTTPKRSALYSSLKDESGDPSFCVFRAPMLNRLRQLAALSLSADAPVDDGRASITADASLDDKRLRTLFHKLMKERLPPIVKLYVDGQTLRACSKRLLSVIKLYERCMQHKEIVPFVLAP